MSGHAPGDPIARPEGACAPVAAARGGDSRSPAHPGDSSAATLHPHEAAPTGGEARVCILPRDPAHPDAAALLCALGFTLQSITGCDGSASFAADDVRGAGAAFLVAYLGDAPVACGGFRPLTNGVAEVKRVFAARRGMGKTLLQALETQAAAAGYVRLVCETRRVNTAAVAFYRKQGWQECAPYGKYVGRDDAICLGKWVAGDATPVIRQEG
ncbi:MAG: GNAT family N-acetyltransferase [Candidatus Limiplasma sp.]|nr:GNAT family N-acetyltransferase [Candidatus Limiplasma sp.]MEA5146487.1 GNAT family N-acetyltransferase [Candidatus Limiplasma sp.]